ncbi:TPA: N-acetyltransferase [Pseudomonas aeruginosa]|nr:N-acetyltransferase [Pseudomonas aeruginosa]
MGPIVSPALHAVQVTRFEDVRQARSATGTRTDEGLRRSAGGRYAGASSRGTYQSGAGRVTNPLRRSKVSESLSIHHDVGGHQFETTVDGHRAYLAYMDLGKQTLDIYRTFVPDSLRGRGIAAALTEHALQYADRMGYSVIPSCSYVERYIERRQRQADPAA